ncbi:preprotein translocase subunit SecE [Candidatus Uhrbacteria bacterium]|nr:preprotein translocase subunit SecE [Candidatus Uhrbacteria bacterium]
MVNPISYAFNYLRSAKAELEKVTWPSRQEVARYSALVIVSCVILAAFFAALDLGLSKSVTALLQRRQGSAPTVPATSPVVPDLQPNLNSGIEAVDAEGKPVDVQVTPIQ